MKRNVLLKGLMGLVILLLVGCGERPPTVIQVTRLVTRVVVVTRIVPNGRDAKSCTLLGCQDRLTIGLTGDRPETFSIDIVYEAGGESMQVSRLCENGRWAANDQPCTEIQLEAAPDVVTVNAHWSGNSTSQVYEPDYEPFRPNGPDCEPVCQVSTITFAFPE
ncbi:MAG: hypothetical protein P8183_11100 [Anaerolineae bacterium]